MIVLAAGDISAAHAAAHGALHALGAGAESTLDALLHGPAEGDALLQLLGDVLSHQLRVGVRHLDLHDVDVGGAAQERFHVLLQGFDARAAAADDHTGLRGEDVDGHAVSGPLNVNVADTGGIVLFLQHFAKFVILHEVIREILLAGIPAGAPIVDNANASTVGIYFLTH